MKRFYVTKVIRFFSVFSYVCDLSLPYSFVNGATFFALVVAKSSDGRNEKRRFSLGCFVVCGSIFVKILTLSFVLRVFKPFAHFFFVFQILITLLFPSISLNDRWLFFLFAFLDFFLFFFWFKASRFLSFFQASCLRADNWLVRWSWMFVLQILN